ncbi:putative membrane protein YqjE [Actinopolyspora biskrensis]|uniref:Putative membrane protein YqjE n=1 Tax=Actinopolyspora biskrensis TaxID=1470178 RepID=A0A852Z5Y3_9ACTN|nr:putative membrane protein YqjE [Actinopolyspora biskrensis]
MTETQQKSPESPVSEHSTTELIRDLGDQLGDLVGSEFRLAQHELERKGKQAGKGAAMFGVAGGLALFGIAGLLTSAVLALAVVLPAWLAALTVGGGMLLLAGLIALVGSVWLKGSTPLAPRETLDGVRWDVRALREATRK